MAERNNKRMALSVPLQACSTGMLACRGNVWPTESLPELQPAFLDLGRLMVETGQLLASHLDRQALAPPHC